MQFLLKPHVLAPWYNTSLYFTLLTVAFRKRAVPDVFDISKFGQAQKFGSWKENPLGPRLDGEENKKLIYCIYGSSP